MEPAFGLHSESLWGSPVSSRGDRRIGRVPWNASFFFFLLDGSRIHVKPPGIVRLISTAVLSKPVWALW